MLNCQLQNTHHSKMPRPGSIGRLAGQLFGRTLGTVDTRRRCIVESYPLTDSPDCRYSRGIHTCTVRFLDDGQRMRLSAFWFDAE